MKKTMLRGLLGLSLICGLTPNFEASTMPKKAWTLMVFLNGDNNLDRFGVQDVEEMTKVGSSDSVNVIVQFDRAYEKPADRLFIKHGSFDVVEHLGEVDMGSVDVYVDFVKWGIENYPADHYAVVMWNHGSGWNKQPGTEIKGISYDDQSGNHITTNQLTDAHNRIAQMLGKKLDILAFDACLMQMLEVSYAVKDSVEVMLASEEVEPGEGWAYTEALNALQKAGAGRHGAEAFATEVVDTYIRSYQNGSQGNRKATQSWVYPARLDKVVETLNAAAQSLMKPTYTDAIKAAISEVQRYHERSNADAIHFLKLLQPSVSAEDQILIAQAIAAIEAHVGHSKNTGGSMANSFGTALYIPTRGWSYNKKYEDLAWAKDTLWDEFLNAHFKASNTLESDLK